MAGAEGAYCETDVEATDLETVIQDLLDGQYSNPVRVVSFNTAEGWSRDISANVAGEEAPKPSISECASCSASGKSRQRRRWDPAYRRQVRRYERPFKLRAAEGMARR